MTSDEAIRTARATTTDAVHRVLRAMGPDTDWRNGITAARMVIDTARDMLFRYARDARGAGLSWPVLAELLDADTDAEDTFRLVAHRPSMPYDPVYATWTCAACGKLIRDKGPLAGHPVDAEEGHGDDCKRHTSEIAEYEARWA